MRYPIIGRQSTSYKHTQKRYL